MGPRVGRTDHAPERIPDMNMIDWRPFPAAFPILFGEKERILSLSAGPGWHQLIWDLCVALEGMARQQVAAGQQPMRVAQVKEKYGSLRFYLTGGSVTDEAFELTEVAEEQSGTICETCGKPGMNKPIHGWDVTYCPKHRREALKRARDRRKDAAGPVSD
jgi:hypothetical protein